MKILNFGSINIDKVYSVSHFVEQGETMKSKDYSEYEGGKGLNQSIALSKAGLPVYHAGKIGKDGLRTKRYLESNNINTDWILENGSITGHAIVQVDNFGNNCILVHGGANDEVTTDEMEQIIAQFDKEDILIIQGEMSITDRLIDSAFAKGMKIVLNPSPVSEEIKNLDFSKIEYIVMNEIEALSIFGYESVEQTIEYLVDRFSELKVLITLGEKGSIYADRSEKYHQTAFRTEAIDSTAARDTFLGYFIGNILQLKGIKSSLQTASKAAAIAVSRKGASSSIPSYSEVISFRIGLGE